MKKDNELYCRSKNCDLYENSNKMFNKAIETVEKIKDRLTDGWIYRGEYLQKPKHNCLIYDRIPKDHIIIYDIDTGNQKYLLAHDKTEECERIGLECVPLLYVGKVDNIDGFKDLLKIPSILGAVSIEGVVIKNYNKFTSDTKTMMSKYVSEQFKEVHNEDWKKRNPGKKEFIYELGLKYKTEQRWLKSIQHLKEAGKLTNSPKDIGMLLKETQADVKSECEEDIKQALFEFGWKQISRIVVGGLPEFYKEYLMKKQFNG
jgi:hypothetical protein